jgi:hypothetical protein
MHVLNAKLLESNTCNVTLRLNHKYLPWQRLFCSENHKIDVICLYKYNWTLQGIYMFAWNATQTYSKDSKGNFVQFVYEEVM